jgi:hypothetical protein
VVNLSQRRRYEDDDENRCEDDVKMSDDVKKM